MILFCYHVPYCHDTGTFMFVKALCDSIHLTDKVYVIVEDCTGLSFRVFIKGDI
jgi:hypothetical protein